MCEGRSIKLTVLPQSNCGSRKNALGWNKDHVWSCAMKSDIPKTSNTVVVDASMAGRRLDHVLVETWSDFSRARLQGLIRLGAVHVDGTVTTSPGLKVKAGAVIELNVPEPEDPEPRGQSLPLDVVFEDDALIVIDKPAGLVVHPSPGHSDGTLVNALIAHCGNSLSGIGGVRRPGIVHRLDKNTSGLLVVAKTDEAHHGLANQFAAHGRDGKLERVYQALVWGGFDRPSGSIDAALSRSPYNRKKMAVSKRDDAQSAVTHYEVLRTFQDRHGAALISQLRVQLETGRTHQIRVHMAHIGHPLVGDPVYGSGFKASQSRLPDVAKSKLAALDRQALHATRLGFEHPITLRRLRFESAIPRDIEQFVQAIEPIT